MAGISGSRGVRKTKVSQNNVFCVINQKLIWNINILDIVMLIIRVDQEAPDGLVLKATERDKYMNQQGVKAEDRFVSEETLRLIEEILSKPLAA